MGPSRSLPAALLLLALVGLPLGRSAQGQPQAPAEDQVAVILFAAEGVDPAQGSRLGDVLRRTMQLGRSAGLALPAVADLDRKNDGMLIVEGDQHLVDATRYFSRGLEHVRYGRAGEAFEEFERSLHFYRSAYPYAQNDRLYLDISFYAAQTMQNLKGRTPRDKAFHRCEAMGLAVELAGAKEVMHKVNTVYPECDWEIEDPELAQLEVATVPLGARVYVDGQFRGVTPVRLKGLRRGEHVFTFVREGFRRVSRLLRVGEKFSEARELEMGLQLKPGVYRGVYKDLIPVVQGVADDEQGVCQKVAQTLEVAGLMMVVTVPNPAGGVKAYVLNWGGKASDPVTRAEFDLDLGSPDAIEDAVVRILGTVYKVDPESLPSLAERAPIYFKVGLPPFQAEEEF